MLVCTVSCHNKLLKLEKAVEDPRTSGKQWGNDTTDATTTSEMLLLAWITIKGNYTAFRGGFGGGESKPAQLQEMSDLITDVGIFPRKPIDIMKKI